MHFISKKCMHFFKMHAFFEKCMHFWWFQKGNAGCILDACASMCMQICMLVPISNMHLHAFLLKVSKFRKHDSKYFCDCQKIFSWFWKHAVLQKVSKISYPDHLPLLLLLRLMQRYFIDFSADLLYQPLAAVRLQWHLWNYQNT